MEKLLILSLFIFKMSMAYYDMHQVDAGQFFLKISSNRLRDGLKIRKAMDLHYINNKLCSPTNAVSQTVSCLLAYRVVGEASAVVVLNVEDRTEMHRRITSLIKVSKADIESKPLVNYGQFAEFLGVNKTLTDTSVNTLENVKEAMWCEYNINFGGMDHAAALALWKEEAEAGLSLRALGVNLELFKTVGERTVHLIIAFESTPFDINLFATPFGMTIRDHLGITCKILNKE